ncbi:hypothetical protein SO694_00005251 [Aureococcus anophagefferens]|uniref:t-SNARE coiled-coil homology domain-containing protein n=1 Tax=Aureococcus anophagefferens TaxID=44056 RepID=A0ABR1GA80_AURAN|nr:hypothetical protein JL722_556 [Aureococcus anophagefferens]
MEWGMAEQGERPRASPPLGSSASTARGGGSVAAMVPALRRAVRDAAAAPERLELVEAARALAESIGANLRPPHAQSLGRQEQRDLRAALRSLEQLEARDLEEAKEAEDRRGPADAPLEIERDTVGSSLAQSLLGEEQDAYSLQLEAEREREIERISGQVSTVNAIYRDLASLVGSQQDDVDEIEQLVAQSHDRTVKGQRQLERAVRKRTAKNKCCMYFACFLLFVIVVVVLAVLVLKTQY